MRVLVVEDEARLAQLLSETLTKSGFTVDTCLRLSDGLALAETERFDAVVADRMLPDGDAIDLIAPLRKLHRDIPILMLTARDAIKDRVDGLEAGADDYLIKPFAMAELIARMRALLRRPGTALERAATAGNLTFDFHSRVVTIDERPQPLSRHELKVLERLVLSTGRVVTKETLLDTVYGLEIPDSNTIPVHIHNLRRRLKTERATVRIHTFRGLGYMLDRIETAS